MAKIWDKKAQSFHGGQEHLDIDNFVCDFSITCNLEPPMKAVFKAKEAVDEMHHYPAANFEPALGDLSTFIWGEDSQNKELLLLGNGASELIDLVIRSCAQVGKWKGGDMLTQYKEYERSAQVNGFEKVDASCMDEDVNLICLINPTNPTGDWRSREEMKEYISQSATRNTCVLVDESMQPFYGPDWRDESLVGEREWCRRMSVDMGVHVFVIHSWTKLWSCPGIRIGSIISPTPAFNFDIKSRQV